MTQAPIFDTPILGMATRPKVDKVTEYGNAASFWVEYPSGLVDVSRLQPVSDGDKEELAAPPIALPAQLDIPVDGRTLRINKASSAFVIIDMQNFFLHPSLRDHPTGLDCVNPILDVVPALRSQGVKILWVNWGLTDHELHTIPPSLARGFRKNGRGGFGSQLPGDFGRLLMRDAYNSDLFGPLQEEYLKGKEAGTDVWIHKNRMSGTLFFGGVNADQCVLGTVVDAYFRGYDCIVVRDTTATTSPTGGLENVLYNAGNASNSHTGSVCSKECNKFSPVLGDLWIRIASRETLPAVLAVGMSRGLTDMEVDGSLHWHVHNTSAMLSTSMAATLAASFPAPQVSPTTAVSVSETIPPTMSKAIDIDAEITPLSVELHASVANNILQRVHENPGHGLLLGIDLDGIIEVFDSFAIPYSEDDEKSAKLSMRYQGSMLRSLKDIGAGDNVVGFYQVMPLGAFFNQSLVESQAVHRDKLRHGGVVVVLDLARIGRDPTAFRAFKLNPKFVDAYQKQNFGTASLIHHRLTYASVLDEVPLNLKRGVLQRNFFNKDSLASDDIPFSLHRSLDLGSAGITCHLEAMGEAMDNYRTEESNLAYLSRQIAREKARAENYLSKRKEENAARVTQGLAPLPEEDVSRLFKVSPEPSRLASTLMLGQIDVYGKNLESSTCCAAIQRYAAKA